MSKIKKDDSLNSKSTISTIDVNIAEPSLTNRSQHNLCSNSLQNGVLVMGPDGDIIQIGQQLNDEHLKRLKTNDDPDFYRLFNEFPSYLHKTNKFYEKNISCNISKA